MFRLENKVVLITGGASGIGLAYGNELLKNNIKGLAIVDLDRHGQDLADKLVESYGDRIIFIQIDVTNSSQLEEAFSKTVEKFKQLDVVINNAGILDEIDWPKMINVNLNATIQGTILAMEKYLPTYKGGEEGVVVNTASVLGIDIEECIPYYCATKHALVGFGRSMGTDYHYERSKVKILTICPGITMTNLLRVDPSKHIRHISPLKGMVRYKKQNSEDVGKALINVIQEGKSGSVWVIENGPPAYEVEFPNRDEMYKKTNAKKLR